MLDWNRQLSTSGGISHLILLHLSFEKRPFGARVCFSVLVSTGSESAECWLAMYRVSSQVYLYEKVTNCWLLSLLALSLLLSSINKTSPCTC